MNYNSKYVGFVVTELWLTVIVGHMIVLKSFSTVELFLVEVFSFLKDKLPEGKSNAIIYCYSLNIIRPTVDIQ